jgi:acyl-CoA thioesterase
MSGRAGVDARLLGLKATNDDATECQFTLAPHLCRPDGALFGGTALSASLAAMELTSGKPALWATVQFVASASVGDRIDCQVVLAARGKYTDQVQVNGSADGRLVFTAIGSAATRSDEGIAGTGLRMPAVLPPDDSMPFGGTRSRSWSENGEVGHHRVSEFREAQRVENVKHDRSHMLTWGRVTGESATTAAKLGFLADMVPVAVCRAVDVAGAGRSLDNSLRVGHLVDTEWVLLEHEGHAADGGYGYGLVHCWSPDGVLMATGSQTARLFSIESFFGRSQ